MLTCSILLIKFLEMNNLKNVAFFLVVNKVNRHMDKYIIMIMIIYIYDDYINGNTYRYI